MASVANYGLKALIWAYRYCPLRANGCNCGSDLNDTRRAVNLQLDQSHQIDEATFNAICLELDQNPDSYNPKISPSQEKQRDDGNFQCLAEEAFKTLRDQEREILLNIPAGPLRHDDSSTDKWWAAAAHLRHYFEFFLVLKGIKPCVLFLKHTPDHETIFTTVVINSLLPIMDRLDLWSYGFKISVMSGDWVFYDARSHAMPQISKIFLTHTADKELDTTGTFNMQENMFGVPPLEAARALGYPIRSDGFDSQRWMNIRDETEMGVLASLAPPEHPCCVQGMIFSCPVGNEDEWADVLAFYYRCEQAARSVGTQLALLTETHPEMTAWLERNPGWLVGPDADLGRSGPKLHAFVEISKVLGDDVQLHPGDVEGQSDQLDQGICGSPLKPY